MISNCGSSILDIIGVIASIGAVVFAYLSWRIQTKPKIEVNCKPFSLNKKIDTFPKNSRYGEILVNNIGHIPACVKEVKVKYGNEVFAPNVSEEKYITIGSFEIKTIRFNIKQVIELMSDDKSDKDKLSFVLVLSTNKTIVCRTDYTKKNIIDIPVVDVGKKDYE